MRLTNGSRVIIVGGGPSGSFTALHLLAQAANLNLQIQVTILEARDFNQPGPGGCNKCAGILSSGLVRNLERLQLLMPPEVIQSELDTYILHGDGYQLPIHLPEPRRRIISIYRGSGPHRGNQPLPYSFDHWLLQQARLRGAEILKSRVRSIRLDPAPCILTAHAEYRPDLVVLATGVNSRLELDPALGYTSPTTEIMAQDEVPLPSGHPDNIVHIFFDHPAGLIFGGLIPKNQYANISLLGHHLPADAMQQFVDYNGMGAVLSGGTVSLCGCSPHVAVSPARGYFSDQFVAVGDAAVTRLYKDGIGSAFLTAAAAAETAVRLGTSRENFAAGYQPTCQRIIRDNAYGKLLFRMWDLLRGSPPMRKAWMKAIISEGDLPTAQRIHTLILWGMFTGDESYRTMLWKLISLASFASLLRGIRPTGGYR